MRTAALLATVAVLLTLLVSHCAGRPWQQHQRQRQQRQRPLRPAAAAAVAIAYEPSTAIATSYAQYDDPSSQAVEDPSSPPSSSSFRQESLDYGDSERLFVEPERVYAEPEQNYEVDEAVSVLSNGRVHGVQNHHHLQTPPTTTVPRISSSTADVVDSIGSISSTTTAGYDVSSVGIVGSSSSTTAASSTASAANNAETRKSGYVVDGKHYRKYRVEEETPDGFIVGEYGVVSHHDGTTRGVRYTADSSINPRVIYEALAKFLNLKRRR